jgi:hypothetical protein
MFRHVDRDGLIRPRFHDDENQHRSAALFLDDVAGEFDRAEVLVVGERRLDSRVTEDRIVDPRRHAGDEILPVDDTRELLSFG